MSAKLHALAGTAGFVIILVFWTATVASELFGTAAEIAAVKHAILWGLLALIPALAAAGAGGMAIGRKRKDVPARAKQRRMPLIAFNGLLILVPSAFFLAARAEAGVFDVWFYAVQALELLAGAANLTLIALNIRDGLRMTGRLGGGHALKRS